MKIKINDWERQHYIEKLKTRTDSDLKEMQDDLEFSAGALALSFLTEEDIKWQWKQISLELIQRNARDNYVVEAHNWTEHYPQEEYRYCKQCGYILPMKYRGQKLKGNCVHPKRDNKIGEVDAK